MTPADIAVALIRTTLATSAAAIAARALLAWLRIDAPRVHRTAWLLVIAQGWLFFPLTIEIETALPPATTKRAAGLVPAEVHEAETLQFENEAQWGQGPFATGDSPLATAPPSQKVSDPLPLAIAAWLLGGSVIVVVAAYRYMCVLCILPLGSTPNEPTWQAEWQSALAAAKLRRRQTVDLRVTVALGPLLHWAPWSYLILVPRELWSALASPERQAILRHELAHLRRHDLWKSLAIRILALPQWFNPLVWLAVRRFDEAAEWACDDAAAATDAGRLTFAASLLQAAEYAVAPYPASAPAARGVLTRRIHRLVSPRFKEESKMKLLVVPLLLLLLAMFQTLRIERVVAEETPQQPPRTDGWSLAEQFNVPIGERLQRARKWHAQLKRLAEMHREFDIAAKAEYVIEAPDVVTVTLRGKKAVGRRGVKEVPDVPADYFGGKQCPVLPDGTIDLGEFGTVHVSGKTVDDAMRTVAGRFIQFANSVSLSVHSYNSKVFFVIVKDADGVGNVTRMPLPYPMRRDVNVGNALAQEFAASDEEFQLPDLSKFSIYILRPSLNEVGKENKYEVEWDVEHYAPSELTNYPILPGDRIFITPNETTDWRQSREETPIPFSPQADEAEPALRYGAYFDDAVPADKPPLATLSASLPDEKRSAWEQEIAFKRIGNSNSLLAVLGSGADNTPGGPTEDSNMELKIAPRWLESGRRLQPFDTLRIRVERPHRPAHALTWGDIEGEFTIDHHGELGRQLSAVPIAGLSVEEARATITRQLRKEFPDCVVHLTLGSLAAEKYAISVRRSDGTEIFAGALPADRLSTSAFAQWSQFNHELGPDAEFQLYPAKSHRVAGGPVKLSTVWDAVLPPGLPATDLTARPGDRLVITVPQGYQPRFLPYWLEPCDAESARAIGRFRISATPGWRELYSTQFDHPDVQRPAGPKYTR